MNSDDLSPEQARSIADQLRTQLVYLSRLKDRIEAEEWPADDPVYCETVAAWEATQQLWLRLHYKSTVGAGEPAKEVNPS